MLPGWALGWKDLISISILYLIIYNKKQYRCNITIPSVFILLCRLSVDLVGLIINKTENVFNCVGENLVWKKIRIFPQHLEIGRGPNMHKKSE